jgi:phosphopantetheine adenylyltransferase
MTQNRISPPYALLLLPSPPSPAVRRLKDAYEPALSHVFSRLSNALNDSNRICVLDIAVAIPGVLSPDYQPRAKLFTSLQHLLASLYTLVGAVSATQNLELDGPGGIDTRIFFVDGDGSVQASNTQSAGENIPLQGPIINLHTLATCQRAWDDVYALDTKAGQQLASSFLAHAKSKICTTVPGGDTSTPGTSVVTPAEAQSQPHYSVAVGGTFDHLHIGHKLLLTATALAVDPYSDEMTETRERLLTIGITGDELLVNKKFAEFLESWEERWQSTASFLNAIIDFTPPENHLPDLQRASDPGPNGKWVLLKATPDLSIRFVQISDPFGPTITDESISALVVSKETRSGGKAVNDERTKKGWPPLEVFEVDVLQIGEVEDALNASAESFESKISSTDIRRRRMNMAKGSL